MPMFSRDQLYNKMGVARTKSLIAEIQTCDENILTLQDTSKPYPSMRSLFLKLVEDDPTESIFAITLFGSVEFWDKMQKVPQLKPYLDKWRHEADVLRKQKAFKYIIKEIEDEGRNAYQAAKYIISEPWKPATKASKASKSASTKEAAPAHIVDLAEEIKKRNEK